MMNNSSHIVRNEQKLGYNPSVLYFKWTHKTNIGHECSPTIWGLFTPHYFLLIYASLIFPKWLPSLYTSKLLMLSKWRASSIYSYALELFLAVVHIYMLALSIHMLCCLRRVYLQVSSRRSNQHSDSVENQNNMKIVDERMKRHDWIQSAKRAIMISQSCQVSLTTGIICGAKLLVRHVEQQLQYQAARWFASGVSTLKTTPPLASSSLLWSSCPWRHALDALASSAVYNLLATVGGQEG